MARENKLFLINFTPKTSTYSTTRYARGKVPAMAMAEKLAGEDAEFVKKGAGPAGYIGAGGAAYFTEAE